MAVNCGGSRTEQCQLRHAQRPRHRSGDVSAKLAITHPTARVLPTNAAVAYWSMSHMASGSYAGHGYRQHHHAGLRW